MEKNDLTTFYVYIYTHTNTSSATALDIINYTKKRVMSNYSPLWSGIYIYIHVRGAYMRSIVYEFKSTTAVAVGATILVYTHTHTHTPCFSDIYVIIKTTNLFVLPAII